MESNTYTNFILKETFEVLDRIDSVFRKKRPSVVSVNFTKKEPMYVIYDKYWFPMGTEVIIDNAINPTEAKFILPSGTEQIIKII